MWIQTRFGFFSIVRKPDDVLSGTLTIRSRVAGDLEAMRDHFLPEMGEIQKTPRNDYRYRAKAPQAAVANAMAKAMMDIGYGNFKNEVQASQGSERAKLYGKVWDVLFVMQDNPIYDSKPKPKEAAAKDKPRKANARKPARKVMLDDESDEVAMDDVDERSVDARASDQEEDDEIPRHKKLPATSKSWENLQPLPERFATISLDFWLDPAQAESIKLGFIPKMMEEKWFAYFENNTLYQHRSWTGNLIDRIHFVEERGGLRATHAEVNRDPEQYSETNDDEDRQRIENMVMGLATLDRTLPRIDPMAAAFERTLQPNYLGSPEVVGKLVQPFIENVIEKRALFSSGGDWKESDEKLSEKMSQMVQIFSGGNPDYTPLSPWNSRDELGNAVVRYFNLDPGYYADESIDCVLSEGLAGVALHVSNFIGTCEKNGFDLETAKAKLMEMCMFTRDVLLGSNTVTFPGKTLKDL